ncbi:Transmembrane ascorbate-dependent reductase CYB561 [Linum grandiflorum]
MRGMQFSALPVTVIAHLIAIATTTLLLVWLLKLRGGLSWTVDPIPNRSFNFVLGAGFYMFKGTKMSTKASYLPWHVFLGSIVFLLAIGTALTGIVQQFGILGLGRNQEGHIVNFIGLLLVLYAVAVGLAVSLPYEK